MDHELAAKRNKGSPQNGFLEIRGILSQLGRPPPPLNGMLGHTKLKKTKFFFGILGNSKHIIFFVFITFMKSSKAYLVWKKLIEIWDWQPPPPLLGW